MMTFTMERVCLLDVVCNTCWETRDFLRHTRLATIFHEDNTVGISALAKKLGILPEELLVYIWLQTYIDELIWSYNDIPSLEVVAKQFGIPLADFEDYLQARASQEFDDELEDLQEDAGNLGD